MMMAKVDQYYENNMEGLPEQTQTKYGELSDEVIIEKQDMEETNSEVFLKKINKN